MHHFVNCEYVQISVAKQQAYTERPPKKMFEFEVTVLSSFFTFKHKSSPISAINVQFISEIQRYRLPGITKKIIIIYVKLSCIVFLYLFYLFVLVT